MNRKDPVLITTAAIVGIASIVASFATLMGLAEFVSWAGRTTWLLPACLDALAVGAGRVWLSSAFDAEARRYARAASLAALGVSVAGNAVGHLVALDHAPWWKVALAILVGAVPPVALAAVGHLLTLTRVPTAVPAVAPRPPAVPAGPAVTVPRPAPVPTTVPRPAPVPASTRTATRTGPASGPGTRDKARKLWESAPANAKPSGADMARALGVDPSLGRRYRREFVSA